MRAVVGAAAAVLVGLLAACSAAPAGHGLGPQQRLGAADWSSATTATPTGRQLTVAVDVRRLAPEKGCPRVTATGTAHESATTITISVEAFSRDYRGPDACGEGGSASVPAVIRLAAPVGNRALIDAHDGSTHAALALSTVPTLTSLPPGFTERGAGWDESTGVIHRWWRHSPQPAQIDLWEYPSKSAEHVPRLPGTPAPVTVAGAEGDSTARWLPPDTQEYSVRWTPTRGTHRLVVVTDQRKQRMTPMQALALARAVD